MKHKNTQPLYIFNRENPQNSEPQNGPRRGLDFIALVLTECVGAKRLFGAVLATASKSKQREGDVIQITLLEIGHWMAHSPTFPLFIHK